MGSDYRRTWAFDALGLGCFRFRMDGAQHGVATAVTLFATPAAQ